MKPDLNTYIVDVTPEWCAESLARPLPGQRPIAKAGSSRWERIVRTDQWRLTSQGLAFTGPPEDRGYYVNGGHRMSGIVAAGRTVPVRVTFNVDPAEFALIDVGARREAYQFVLLKYRFQACAAARALLWYRDRFNQSPAQGMRFELREVLDEIDARAQQMNDLSPIASVINHKAHIPAGMVIATAAIAQDQDADPDRLATWLDGLATGIDLGPADPRLALRERFGDNEKRVLGGSARSRINWTLVTNALNAYMAGESVEKVRYDSRQPWPRVVAVPTRSRESESKARRRERAARQRTPEIVSV